jgi:hypothetical protein
MGTKIVALILSLSDERHKKAEKRNEEQKDVEAQKGEDRKL